MSDLVIPNERVRSFLSFLQHLGTSPHPPFPPPLDLAFKSSPDLSRPCLACASLTVLALAFVSLIDLPYNLRETEEQQTTPIETLPLVNLCPPTSDLSPPPPPPHRLPPRTLATSSSPVPSSPSHPPACPPQPTTLSNPTNSASLLPPTVLASPTPSTPTTPASSSSTSTVPRRPLSTPASRHHPRPDDDPDDIASAASDNTAATTRTLDTTALPPRKRLRVHESLTTSASAARSHQYASMKPQNGENGVNGMNGVMNRKGEGMNGSHSEMMTVDANGGKGVRTQELVRLMVQSMHDMGYSEAAAALERESGFMLETPSIRQFREGVLTGDWQLVETLLSVLELDQDKDALNHYNFAVVGDMYLTNDPIIWTSHVLQEIKFLIRQQKYLELLEGRNIKKALQVLRNELTPLEYSLERLHALSSLIMYADVADLKKRADWDGAGGMSRQKLLLDLQKYISPSIMVPERRLETLLKQAMTLQLKNCLYHNSEDESITLFSDHVCDRAQFPCITTNILDQHTDEVWYVAFSHDGRYLASVSKDKNCIVWSMESMEPYRHLIGHTMDVAYCAWSPDDTKLLTCGISGDDNLRLWDVSTGVCLNILRKHDDQVTSCAWLPDGEQFVSGDMVKNIYLWDTYGNVLHKWSGPRVTDLAINREGTCMYAICNEKKIWAYDLVDRTAQALWTIQETSPLTSICLSLDGRFALVNLQTTQELHLWDLENKILAHKYVGHTHMRYVIRSCFGGINERFVVSGSEDSCVYVWHREQEQLIEVLQGHSQTVNSISWNPVNPNMFASASDDRSVRLWGLPHSDRYLDDKGKMRTD